MFVARLFTHGKQSRQQKLLYAAKNGNVSRLLLLFDNDPMILRRAVLNENYPEGLTPLHLSAENGFLDAVKVLVDNGSDVTSMDAYGRSALYLAASNDYPEVCGYLVKARSPLYCCIYEKEGEAMKESPLHRACEKGYLTVVKVLVSGGADINLRVSDLSLLFNDAPIHRAAKEGQLECIKFLVAAGALLDIINDDGNTPLHLAAYCGHTHVVEFLIISGKVHILVLIFMQLTPFSNLISPYKCPYVRCIHFYIKWKTSRMS